VRQAVKYAIDNEVIVKTILYGEAEPAIQMVHKGHWGYNPAVGGYPYNPEKAKKLLAEAGYPNGFKTRLLYRTNPQADQIYTAVQGYLKAVGIDAELDPSQTGRFDQFAIQGGKWEGLIECIVSSNTDAVGPLSIRFSGSSKYYSQMLVPDDYLRTIQNAINAPDFETKQKWVQETMKLMIDKYCLQIPIYCPLDFAISRTQVHNHGVMENPDNGIWTPEDAWAER
jgi:ABC-type transport system substrate-binding protein